MHVIEYIWVGCRRRELGALFGFESVPFLKKAIIYSILMIMLVNLQLRRVFHTDRQKKQLCAKKRPSQKSGNCKAGSSKSS